LQQHDATPSTKIGRRGLIAGLAALAGMAATTLARPKRALAATGGNFILGSYFNSVTNVNDTTRLTHPSVTVLAPSLLALDNYTFGPAFTAPAGTRIAVAGSTRGPDNAGSVQRIGVYGHTDDSVGGAGAGVYGESPQGFGVYGRSAYNGVRGVGTGNGSGVSGFSTSNIGLYGRSESYVGLYGESARQVGISAVAHTAYQPALYLYNAAPAAGGGKFAALMDGNVFISGSLNVAGAKNAVVPHPDGSMRTLYCQESPEPWFEDFGRAQLVNGVAQVKLDAEFAALASVTSYHVFTEAEGDCNGLYVTQQTPAGFEVRETNGGRHSLSFSYRIVAKRKDIAGPRLAKVDPRMANSPAAVHAAVHGGGAPAKPHASPPIASLGNPVPGPRDQSKAPGAAQAPGRDVP
jgi:hypothetical protein